MKYLLKKISLISLLFIASLTQAQKQIPDQMPVYPGCEQSEQTMQCMRSHILDFIGENFNSDLLHQIKDTKEVNIYVQFIILSTGEISNIEIKTAYPKIQKEMERVLGKLPKIKPAKIEGNPIDMRYEMPISFDIKSKK